MDNEVYEDVMSVELRSIPQAPRQQPTRESYYENTNEPSNADYRTIEGRTRRSSTDRSKSATNSRAMSYTIIILLIAILIITVCILYFSVTSSVLDKNGKEATTCNCYTTCTATKTDLVPWMLQETNVCFGAKNDRFGRFYLKETGKLIGLMLEHKSGYVACHTGGYNSHWGCHNNIHVNGSIGVYITDRNNIQIFPRYARAYPTQMDWLKRAYFYLPGYNEISAKLVFTDMSTPMYAFKGQELRIWYGEDRVDYSEETNIGESCADVYAQFS